tara:strand:+ start:229 stop:804 length:576 start_codon:yes stop_codon:yes gene_type:complete
MQARYYDPVIGRFYSNDPVGMTDIHTFNRYAYANNNPYKYTDPDGEAAQLVIKAGQLGYRAGNAINIATQLVTGASLSTHIANAVFDLVHNESSDVDGFVDDLKGRSESDANSGKSKIRTLTDGSSVDDAFDDFPGEEGEASDGSKVKTGSDGTTAHVHDSSKDSGKKTLNIKRPTSKKPIKFREPEKKSD